MEKYSSQSGFFSYTLWEEMAKDKKIWVLDGDLGHGVFDDIQKDYPDRYINVGAAEQTMLDMGVGLAMSGQIPICYSITPFLLYRGFETIRNYINREKIPVILVGRSRDREYANCGFSHWAEEDLMIMTQVFRNIHSCWPNSNQEASDVILEAIKSRRPTYINLSRK